MYRIPILQMGSALLVTIQVDMHDQLAAALQAIPLLGRQCVNLIDQGQLGLGPRAMAPPKAASRRSSKRWRSCASRG